MLSFVIKKVIGSKNDREVKRMRPTVARINEQEQPLLSLSDEQLRAKTDEFKKRIEEGRQQRG